MDYCRIHGVQWISLEVRRREKYYTDTGEDALVLQLELADALKLPFSQKI